MKTYTSNSETYCQLVASLDWREKAAERSARCALAKAQALGLARDEAFEPVKNYPAAEYVRKNPHILSQAWAITSCWFDPNNYWSEAEQLLNATN